MPNGDILYVSWTSGDPLTAKSMVLMYLRSSIVKKRWERVHLIVWGAAAELLCTDASVRDMFKEYLELGGEASTCRRCLENLGRLDEFEAFKAWGKLDIFYVGDFFTKVIKEEHLICV